MILIKNGYIIDPKTGREGVFDILIKEDKIVKIDSFIMEVDFTDEERKDLEIIYADNMMIAPGLVDVHVHFRDPGFTYKEDIYTGAKAAAKGGYTTVVLMANTKPTVDNEETLQYVMNKGKETDIHVLTCAAITKGLQGKELTDMESLKNSGAVGFTDDGIPMMDEKMIIEAMKKAKDLSVPLSFHEENPELITNNGINRGKASAYYEIGGSPRAAEIDLIAREEIISMILDNFNNNSTIIISSHLVSDIEKMLDKFEERATREETARHEMEIKLAEVDQRARSAHARIDVITKILAAQNN